jgi:transcriptional regulator with XRE-family HTH domain
MRRQPLESRSLVDVTLRVNLRLARIRKGLSMRQLARLAHVSTTTVTNHENGVTGIGPELQRMAECLGVPVHVLVMPQPGDDELLAQWHDAIRKDDDATG